MHLTTRKKIINKRIPSNDDLMWAYTLHRHPPQTHRAVLVTMMNAGLKEPRHNNCWFQVTHSSNEMVPFRINISAPILPMDHVMPKNWLSGFFLIPWSLSGSQTWLKPVSGLTKILWREIFLNKSNLFLNNQNICWKVKICVEQSALCWKTQHMFWKVNFVFENLTYILKR